MKLLKSTLILASISLTAFSASAENTNYYIKADAGYSDTTRAVDDFNKMGNSGVYDIAFGYQFNENFRTDLELNYRGKYTVKNKDSSESALKGNLQSYGFMLNGYYDIINYNGFTPFVGAGIGMSRNKTSSITETYTGGTSYANISGATRNEFTWKLIAGAKCSINNSFDINAQYQFAHLGKFASGSSATATSPVTNRTISTNLDSAYHGKLRAHEFLAGITYKF